MKLQSIFLILLFLISSCKKKEDRQYTIDTLVEIIISDNEGVDLLDISTPNHINIQNITLAIHGDNDENFGKPPAYPYFTMLEYAAPEIFKLRTFSEAMQKNSLTIALDHTLSNTNTIIDWNNGYSKDTLRGKIVLDKKHMVVKCVKLYLNDEIVWTEASKQNRIVNIIK